MPSLKDIRSRIASVRKTKQITSAMKLVASVKMRRATERALAARPYRDRLDEVLRRLAASAGDQTDEPLLRARPQVRRVLVVVLTSDRGLCGPFNNTLLRQTWDWIGERRGKGQTVDVMVYGRKGQAFFRRVRESLVDQTVDYGRTPKMDLVRPLTAKAVAGFVDEDYDEVYLAYNRFKSALVQRPTYDRVLPIGLQPGGLQPGGLQPGGLQPGATEAGAARAGAQGGGGEYRYEPSAPEILGQLLPLYLQTIVLGAFLETEAGEFAARMTAMDSATRNASDLIDRLTLDYNRARQAAITKEIIEIVSGAAAL